MRETTFNCVFIIALVSSLSSYAEKMSSVPIATYEEVKDLPNHPEKLLIDVREPAEIAETGSIPTAINIPCKFDHCINLNCPEHHTIPLQSESCSTVLLG